MTIQLLLGLHFGFVQTCEKLPFLYGKKNDTYCGWIQHERLPPSQNGIMGQNVGRFRYIGSSDSHYFRALLKGAGIGEKIDLGAFN